MKTFCFFIFFVFCTELSLPQSVNTAVLKKYISGIDTALAKYSATELIRINEGLENCYRTDSTQFFALYFMAYSEYKLLEMSIGKNKDTTGLFDRFSSPAELHASSLAALDPFVSEGKTLLAAIYMMRIAHDWSEAMKLSFPINALLAEAEKIDPRNPRAFYINGLMKLKTPEMFGGSKEEALKLFLKANALFEAENEKSNDNISPRWGYLENLAWTGIASTETGNLETAKYYYTKILQVNPEYGWVKYNLLPELEKKMNKE